MSATFQPSQVEEIVQDVLAKQNPVVLVEADSGRELIIPRPPRTEEEAREQIQGFLKFSKDKITVAFAPNLPEEPIW